MLFEALAAKKDLLLCDMPELMLRMKVASLFSLDQLKEIFNDILNKVASARDGEPSMPDIAAYFYYADVFQKPRDEYMAALLKEVANETWKRNDKYVSYSSVSCYLGNLHVSPVARLWKTSKLDSMTQTIGDQKALVAQRRRGSSNSEPSIREIPYKQDTKSDYISVCQFVYNMDEKAEAKIAKQALLEALFQTNLWSEPYVMNPFIYVSDKDSDFEGEEGRKLKEYFTKVFYAQYKKYKEAVDLAVEPSAYQQQRRRRQQLEGWMST